MIFSPTYKEEEEESRLQDFTDEELDSGDSSPRLSPRVGRPANSVVNGLDDGRGGGGRVPPLGLDTEEGGDGGGCGLAQSRSNLSQLDGSLRSQSSDRFRDSIDTVVRVSLASPQDRRTSTLKGSGGPRPQLECIFR